MAKAMSEEPHKCYECEGLQEKIEKADLSGASQRHRQRLDNAEALIGKLLMKVVHEGKGIWLFTKHDADKDSPEASSKQENRRSAK